MAKNACPPIQQSLPELESLLLQQLRFFASGTVTNMLKTNADLSTMFDPKSATSSTSGFMIPAWTTLILFSLIEHSKYKAAAESFF